MKYCTRNNIMLYKENVPPKNILTLRYLMLQRFMEKVLMDTQSFSQNVNDILKDSEDRIQITCR